MAIFGLAHLGKFVLYKMENSLQLSKMNEGHVMNIYSICETKNNILIGTGEGIYIWYR